MSHFIELRCYKRAKAVGSPPCDGMRAEQRKAWYMSGINTHWNTDREKLLTLDLNDRALACLLRRFIFVQPPPEVWERIKENVHQMRLTQLPR